jgi:hypothetical protein
MESHYVVNFGRILTDEVLMRMGNSDPAYHIASGLSAYIPIELLSDAIQYQLKPEIGKPINYTMNDGPSNEVFAGAKVGVRYANITLCLGLNRYSLDTDVSKPSRLYFTVLHEKVGGIIGLHIAKEAPFGWGDIHNRVYTINFELKLKNLTFIIDLGSTSDGFPKLDIGLSLEGLDAQDDLVYTINEKDLLTFVADISKPFWIGEINKVIQNELLPVLTSQMNHTVNMKIREIWRTHIDFENETNFRINLRIEKIVTTRRFVRLLVNGHVQNRNEIGKVSENFNISHRCHTMKDISPQIGAHKKIYIQLADCVVESAIKSYFQNPLSLSIPLESTWFKTLEISHNSKSPILSSFERSAHPSDPSTHNLSVRIGGDFEFKVIQRLPIPIHFHARAQVSISNPTYWGESGSKHGTVCFGFDIEKPQIGAILDKDGNVKELAGNGIATVLPKLQEKLDTFKLSKIVEVDAIRILDSCWILPDLMHVLDGEILLTMEVVYV